MNRPPWITAAAGLAGVAAGAIGMFAAQGSAAPAPVKPAVQTTIAPPACEGTGSTSFCHITIRPDGTEWLFYEGVGGTIIAQEQTPPR